jgi:hypothetical protein
MTSSLIRGVGEDAGFIAKQVAQRWSMKTGVRFAHRA